MGSEVEVFHVGFQIALHLFCSAECRGSFIIVSLVSAANLTKYVFKAVNKREKRGAYQRGKENL